MGTGRNRVALAGFRGTVLYPGDEGYDDSRKVFNAMIDRSPALIARVYLNFLGDEGQERVESGFGAEKYARLQRTKATWDPTNLFRHNQNIPPAPSR